MTKKGKVRKGKHGNSIGRCPTCMTVLKNCHTKLESSQVIVVCPICKNESTVSELKGGR